MNLIRITIYLASYLLLSVANSIAFSQSASVTLTPAIKEEVINEAAEHLEGKYVLPDVGRAMAEDLRNKLEAGVYSNIGDVEEFTRLITEHILAVSNDEHLWVYFSDPPVPTMAEFLDQTPQEAEQELARLRSYNFGFIHVDRLGGNYGYIESLGFFDASLAESTVASAMDLLQYTDGLIIDLRRNGGGEGSMGTLLASYLLGPQPTHINSIYWRIPDEIEEVWTSDNLEGAWYGTDRPVYILTSSDTFSAAEGFSYALQAQGRATIVGEITGGGAHPGGVERIREYFSIFVPHARSINPITGTNWEGTGVTPDVIVPAEEAMRAAQVLLLEELIKNSEDSPARREKQTVLERLQ